MKVFLFGILYFYSLYAFSKDIKSVEDITFEKIKHVHDLKESAKLAELQKIEAEKNKEQIQKLRENYEKITTNLESFNEYFDGELVKHEASVEQAKAEKESCEKLSMDSVSIVSDKCKEYDRNYQSLLKSKPDLKQSFDKMKDEARVAAIELAELSKNEQDIETVKEIESSVELELSTEELLCQKQSETCDKARLDRLKSIQTNSYKITDPAKFEAVKNEMTLPKKKEKSVKNTTKEKRKTYDVAISKKSTRLESNEKASDVSVKLRSVAKKVEKTKSASKVSNSKTKDRAVAKVKKRVASKDK